MKIIYQPLFLLISLYLLTACESRLQSPPPTASGAILQSPPPAASGAIERIRAFAYKHYGQQLVLSDAQLEQLAWVEESQFYTPEAAGRTDIHPEVPRALSRLYNLQRLRSGTPADYQAFVGPQVLAGNRAILSKSGFEALSHPIKAMNKAHYDVLAAASIISGVSRSPEAIRRATPYLGRAVPPDSVQFLTATAPHADDIYPLAHQVISQYPEAKALFKVVFMPDSHLRHMLYNEGSLSMYGYLEQGIRSRQLSRGDVDLWYSYWVVNIAGFRGHLSGPGSLYLDQHTFEAINDLHGLLVSVFEGDTQNLMRLYLKRRAQRLGLNTQPLSENERLALAALGAMIRLYTPTDGSALVAGFKQLDSHNKALWVSHRLKQLQKQTFPSETYGPAVFANVLKQVSLAETIKAVIPLYNSVVTEEQRMRQANELPDTVPVSFQALARQESVDRLLQHPKTAYPILINRETGVATLTPPSPEK